MPDRILLTYQLRVDSNEVSNLARKIAIEQSVETPESIITPAIEKDCVGQIESINPVSSNSQCFEVQLSYPPDMLSQQFNQLLNLCFGNVSMYPDVRLTDIHIPAPLLENFDGPGFGVDGIRRRLGVFNRPLLATALKPRGQSISYFADLAYQFACGGGDIIKDDQNLIGDFSSFKTRVSRCMQAVKDGSQKSGRPCLYFPYIAAPFEQMEEYFSFAKTEGVKGVLLSPLIIGMDTARGLAKKYNLMYMAHPSFTGSYCIQGNHGINYELLYGLLFRLAGVDISVFPNQGGRFSFTENDCKRIATALTQPMSNLRTAFPCPAGGMQFEHLHTMCSWFGEDAVFLLGGSLLEYSDQVAHSTRAFRERISEFFPKLVHKAPADQEVSSSCDMHSGELVRAREVLRFSDYQWEGRENVVYKSTTTLPFDNVRRVELIGKSNEQCSFDLRYFEIGKNGYSSKEKHLHTHVIIGARGSGQIIINDLAYAIGVNDVVYVRPMVVHQLIAGAKEDFGFYCIVDRVRDNPQQPH